MPGRRSEQIMVAGKSSERGESGYLGCDTPHRELHDAFARATSEPAK